MAHMNTAKATAIEATSAGSSADRVAKRERLARQILRRAFADIALLVLIVFIASQFGRTAHEALLITLLASSAGIFLFLHRRGRDLARLSRADDWRAEALEGRGLSLEQWRAGQSLAGWEDRRDPA